MKKVTLAIPTVS